MAHLFNESAEIVGNNSEGFSSSEEWETMSHTLQESKLYTTTESDSVSTHSESTNEPSEMEPSEFDQNEIGLVKTGLDIANFANYIDFSKAKKCASKSLKRSQKEVEYVRDALMEGNNQTGRTSLPEDIASKILNAAECWISAEKLLCGHSFNVQNRASFFRFGPLPGKVMKLEFRVHVSAMFIFGYGGYNARDQMRGILTLVHANERNTKREYLLFKHKQMAIPRTHSGVLSAQNEFLRETREGDILELSFEEFAVHAKGSGRCGDIKMTVYCQNLRPFRLSVI